MEIPIGIVLPEDEKQEIKITTPVSGIYRFQAPDKTLFFQTNEEYLFQKKEDILLLRKGEDILWRGYKGAILQEGKEFLSKEHCITIHQVISGRKFHWRKTIDQQIPGNFSITLDKKGIILVNNVDLNVYILCVSISEMSPLCPKAFLDAQMIVARSWLLANVEKKHPFCMACNDDCCQRYQGITHLKSGLEDMVYSNKDMVLYWNEHICDTRYSKSCGGITEDSYNVWPEISEPYMKARFDKDTSETFLQPLDEKELEMWLTTKPDAFCNFDGASLQKYLGKVDDKGSYFRWNQEYSQKELITILKDKCQKENIHMLHSIHIEKRGKSGRVIKLRIIYSDFQNKKQELYLTSEYAIRNALHSRFLYSSAFIIEEKRDHENNLVSLKFIGGGWGHGAGLCQIGALAMALKGYTAKEILLHYFPGTSLKELKKMK